MKLCFRTQITHGSAPYDCTFYILFYCSVKQYYCNYYSCIDGVASFLLTSNITVTFNTATMMLQTLTHEVQVVEFNSSQSASKPFTNSHNTSVIKLETITRVMNRPKVSEHILKTNYLLLLDVTWSKILLKVCAPFQTITGTSFKLNKTLQVSPVLSTVSLQKSSPEKRWWLTPGKKCLRQTPWKEPVSSIGLV